MGLKSFNPYTASRRFITVVDKSHITKQMPEKQLLEPKKRSGGRNNHGEIVVWHRGGGHKRQYRTVDFRRDKEGVPAKVVAIEYDPNRSANIALLHYADGEKRYILHPVGLEVGATVSTGETADILPGNALRIRNIPPGTMVHNLELYPGRGGQAVRTAWPPRPGYSSRLCTIVPGGMLRIFRALPGRMSAASPVETVAPTSSPTGCRM